MKQLPEADQRRMVDLREGGMSYADIGATVGCDKATAFRTCRRLMGKRATEARPVQARGKSHLEIGVPVDERGDDSGDCSIVTLDKPRTLDEMYEMFGIDRSLWIASQLRVNEWQGWHKLRDSDGIRKVNLWQTRVSFTRVIAQEAERAILKFTRQHVKAIPKPKLPRRRKVGTDGFAVSWGLWDAHLGMYAWADEVGEDFDLQIASKRVFNSIDDIVEELKLYNVNRLWMPIGNDFLHFDSVRMTTTRGEHFLDTDTRYGKVFLEGLRCLSYMVERATELCDDVELIYTPGNHDLATSYCLTVALAQRFRLDPRVKADLSFNPRKYRRHGGTLLGYAHGQKPTLNQLAMTMPAEAGELWNGATYKEYQLGHTHAKNERLARTLIPTNGVILRTNPALCNTDSWHHDNGFVGEVVRGVEAWRYDDVGYRGSHCSWVRDEASAPYKEFKL